MVGTLEITDLKDRHHALEVEIETENARPAPDELRIQTLKKEKLRIKDELQRLQST